MSQLGVGAATGYLVAGGQGHCYNPTYTQPHTESDPLRHVSSAEVERPCSTVCKPASLQTRALSFFCPGYETAGMNFSALRSLKEFSATVLKSLESFRSFPLSWAC